jgi:hypothetical protein
MKNSFMEKMTNKRHSKDFVQISGYVPKELAIEFKVKCARLDISRSEAVTESIKLWIEREGKI